MVDSDEGQVGRDDPEALLMKVFWPWNVWPDVLRSDNAAEFIGEVIRYVNQKLEIKHVTGASWRPQCQGMAENRVKLTTRIMQGFVQGHPERWMFYLPAVEGAMRALPQESLGGRCPMEVVMGLQPKIPTTLANGLPVQDIGVERYVVMLVDGMMAAHQEILQLAKDKAVEHEGYDEGRAQGLVEGDTVMVRKAERVSRRAVEDSRTESQTRSSG